MKIRTRLMLAFVGCGVVPIAVVGYLNYRTAVTGMGHIQSTAVQGFQERAQAQLVALRDVKKTQVQRYCQDRRADLNALANNVAAARTSAFDHLTGIHTTKKLAVEAEFKRIIADVESLGTSENVRQLIAKFARTSRRYSDGCGPTFECVRTRLWRDLHGVGRPAAHLCETKQLPGRVRRLCRPRSRALHQQRQGGSRHQLEHRPVQRRRPGQTVAESARIKEDVRLRLRGLLRRRGKTSRVCGQPHQRRGRHGAGCRRRASLRGSIEPDRPEP